MEYKAKLSYLRISPRKVRMVADLVRGQNAQKARYQLKFATKRASNDLLKLLNSAISNAKDINENVKEADLYIKKLTVDEGPMYKRYMPVARGAAHEIQKKSSHITIILSDEVDQESKKTSKKEEKATVKDKKEVKAKK